MSQVGDDVYALNLIGLNCLKRVSARKLALICIRYMYII